MRILMVIMLLCIGFTVKAQHGDHSIGVHGMVLMWVDGKVLASHMPLPQGMHAVQLIIELKPGQEQFANIKALFEQYELVSLMPETFSLAKLRQGEIDSFKGTVFGGHFERGGKALIDNASFEVGEQLLNQALTAKDNGAYHVVALNNQLCLLVHRIAGKPSFDQILLAKYKQSDALPNEIRLNRQKPLKMLSHQDFDLVKPLYLEIQDFQ